MDGHLHAMGKHGPWRLNLTINAVFSKTTTFSIKLRELFRRFSELRTSTEIDARFSDAHHKAGGIKCPSRTKGTSCCLSSASIVSRNKWFKCGRGLSFTRCMRNRLSA
jgi:hypothetical protein